MDGRDIGTVVLPDATVKIFLTATPEARATRRWKEYQAKGIDTPYEEVLADVKQRDYQDTHRAAAPLKQAENATPTPREAAKTTELMPSSRDLAKRVVWSPVRPSCKAPTMAMAPTQNSRLAVTKPSAMEGAPSSCFTSRSVFAWTQSPR